MLDITYIALDNIDKYKYYWCRDTARVLKKQNGSVVSMVNLEYNNSYEALSAAKKLSRGGGLEIRIN